MCTTSWRRTVVLLLLLAPVAACSQTSPDSVQTGAPSGVSTSVAVAPSTMIVAADGGPSAPSPVEGLSAAELRAAVEAPVVGTKRAATGPVLDRVVLPGGTTVWRVRIPGDFPVRSARVIVSVGGRRIGQGVSGPRLTSLIAVTRTATGLVAGAPVSYQWAGSPPVAAGRLQVAR